MITLEFLGVGDAFDSLRGNASILLHSESKILIDCGYLTPYFFTKANYPVDFLDAVYISHLHPDHSFGLIPLVVNFAFNGRKKPLTIIGKAGIQEFTSTLAKLSFSEFEKFAQFDIQFIETISLTKFKEFSLEFAPTIHPSDPYSIKLSAENQILGFSSDGKLTAEQKQLFLDCTSIVYNTEYVTKEHPVHCNMQEVLDYTKNLNSLKNLAFIHLSNKISRQEIQQYVKDSFSNKLNIFIPEPLDKIQLK